MNETSRLPEEGVTCAHGEFRCRACDEARAQGYRSMKARIAELENDKRTWERLARDWQLKFINMRQWVNAIRSNALHGSDYVKVARVFTAQALEGKEAPGYDTATAELAERAKKGEK